MISQTATPTSRRKSLAVIAIAILVFAVVQVARPQPAQAATNTGIVVCSADFNTINVGSTLGYLATVHAQLFQWNGSAWVGPVRTLTGSESVNFSGLSDGTYAVAVFLYGGWTGYQWQRVAPWYAQYEGYRFLGTRSDYCFV